MQGLPLFTTNPDDFTGLGNLLPVMPRPARPSRTNDHPGGRSPVV
jgi:hypothetical protein